MSQPVRFTHNTRNPRLRYTVAYSFNKSADGVIDVTYGIAQCRNTDTFSRAEGRKLAEARLNKALKGKVAAVIDQNTGIASTPLYGKLAVKDHDGLSVGKFVSETFEGDRTKALAYNSQANKAVDKLIGDIFGNFGISL